MRHSFGPAASIDRFACLDVKLLVPSSYPLWAMSLRRLEWTMCGTGERSPFSLCEALDRTEPVAWRLPGPQKSLQETEEEPGYYVPHLWFRVDDEHLLLMDADLLLNKYWLYNLQVLEVNGSRSVWYRDSRIAIREVPHDLVYNCRLCVTAKAYF